MEQIAENGNGPFTERLNVGTGALAPRVARLALREALDPHVHGNVLADAELLVSELVTNAIRHSENEAQAPVTVELELVKDTLRVRCLDGGHGFSDSDWGSALGSSSGGFGLLIVDRLASRWGATNENAGHCVWFEIDVEQQLADRPAA